MVCFLRFPWENNFLCLFCYIWIKRHCPLIIHLLILMRYLFMISTKSKGLSMVEKSDVSSANDFAVDSNYQGDHLCIPRRTLARIGNQFEDWPLGTTLCNLSLRKLSKSFFKLPQISAVSNLYSNPSCQTYQRLFRYPRSLLLLHVNLIKICINTISNWQ